MNGRMTTPGRNSVRTVRVTLEDASIIKKVRRILATGKEVEIRNGSNGKLKILKVSKELEEE